MDILSSRGIPVFCRLQPFIPLRVHDTLSLIRALPAVGCHHVSAEHLKLPLERRPRERKQLAAGLGPAVWNYYRKMGATRAGREWVLPSDVKEKPLRTLKAAVNGAGMTFGAADNDLQHLSDTLCCCSGVDQVTGFQNFFRHQLGYALRVSRHAGVATYDSIADEWCPRRSPNRFLNSNVRRSHDASTPWTIADYIRDKWNSPGTQNSPTSWSAVRPKGDKDVHGNEVYVWT
jgi:hypothetical protein